MKEFIEKLIGRLEECEERYDDVSFAQLSEFGITLDYKYAEGKRDGVAESISIVNELAEEYINTSTDTSSGWIPCSERLPEEDEFVIASVHPSERVNGGNPVIITRYDSVSASYWHKGIIQAWQPLPAPYKEGVTENE